jgi:hypothetical protein
VIKRHDIHPQLWVMGGGGPTKTEAEQAQRIEQEAERVQQIVVLAAPCRCKVELYNHNGWFGQPDNEVAVIKRLREKGVDGVEMVYNFSHGHGDMAEFPSIWRRIAPFVIAVNVSGMVADERLIPPSQGDKELDMLRAPFCDFGFVEHRAISADRHRRDALLSRQGAVGFVPIPQLMTPKRGPSLALMLLDRRHVRRQFAKQRLFSARSGFARKTGQLSDGLDAHALDAPLLVTSSPAMSECRFFLFHVRE